MMWFPSKHFGFAALAVSLAMATPVQAQSPGDFFAALFGGLVRPQTTAVPQMMEAPPQAEVSRPARTTAYCVRMCDGRYFPLSSGDDAEAKCNSFCPASEARVFRGGNVIDDAQSADGRLYSSIPNAFVYRTKLVDSCSCTGKGPLGVASPALEDDDTLRPGDVVMTKDGPRVFQGKAGSTPHPASAFVAPENASRLSRDMKARIKELELAGTVGGGG